MAIAGAANRSAAQIAVPASQRDDRDFIDLGATAAGIEIQIILVHTIEANGQVKFFRIS
jgi:hypothetical protein